MNIDRIIVNHHEDYDRTELAAPLEVIQLTSNLDLMNDSISE